MSCPRGVGGFSYIVPGGSPPPPQDHSQEPRGLQEHRRGRRVWFHLREDGFIPEKRENGKVR